MIDDRFGRLVVIGLNHRKGSRNFYECRCDCGNRIIARDNNLRTGNTRSCGCLRREGALIAALANVKIAETKILLESRLNSSNKFLDQTDVNHAKAVRTRRLDVVGNSTEYKSKHAIKESRRRAKLKACQTVKFSLTEWEQRKSVFGNRCFYCGQIEKPDKPLEIDHFKPIHLGGPHMLSNLRPACRSCNSAKGATNPIIYMQKIGVRYG